MKREALQAILSAAPYGGRAKRRVPMLLAAALFWVLGAGTGLCAGVLKVEIVNGYNLVVDSNVTAPSTYAPKSAYIGAKICNTGDAPLANVVAYVGDYVNGVSDTPGQFPVLNSNTQSAGWKTLHPHVANTGNYSLTLESGRAGISDGTRYIGTLAPGECKMEYWLFSYPQCVNVDSDGDGVFEPQSPPCDVSMAGTVKPEDDVSLDYDVWATTTTSGVASATKTRSFTMRNEISASANKIWPNTDAKVPDEYLDAIQSVVGWGTLGPDGQPLTTGNPVYPGQRLITTQGIWYDLGTVVHGFDNNNDLTVDQNAWLQPVGDPSSFDAGCFRMVNVYGIVVVKLRTGGEFLIPFQNQLYFENLPDNTGAVGLVYYQFIATGEGCSAAMTPYQEAASGYDNEKFSADYGLSLGLESGSYGSALSFSKTDGVASTSAGSTLTYALTATNSGTGVSLGAPDLGVPLTFYETVPEGTTYVAASADDNPMANLTEPSGTGTYNQGFTDRDGNLDSCPVNFNITSSYYVIQYSNDNGATWSTTEPAGVTNIKWMLVTNMTLDGSHDGNDCVAPDGVYDDGSVVTSLPPGKSAVVRYQVTVNSNGGPVICNDAMLGYGAEGTGVQAQDCTLVTGNNTLSGTVFRDNGGTTGIFGNGVMDGDETGVGGASGGVVVTLFYDADGDGELSAADIIYGTTTAASNGTYSFTSLPDGPYLVEARKYDGPTPDGVNNSVDDFVTGWGNTTYDPNLSPLTDQGTIKMTEDPLTVTLAVNIDLDGSTSTAQTVSNVNFGFAPPLRLNKVVAGNPDANNDGKADLPVDEGDLVSYVITLENRLPSVGVQGPTGCMYTVWTTSGVNGTPANKEFTNPGNAWDSTSPNRTVASALVSGGGLRYIYGTSFGMAQRPGAITKVEALFFGYFSTKLSDDYLALAARLGGSSNTGTVSTAQIESYVGEPADLDPNSAISWDISTRKPGGTGAVTDWLWTDYANLQLEVNPSKVSSADQKYFYLDAIGVRVTTDADCEAGQSTTLSPVPLQDTYDPARFAFVSAVPAPTSVNTTTGVIQWLDVGPILPGTSATVVVTLRALDVNGTTTGTCTSPVDGCNAARTDYSTYHVYYADGRKANDDNDSVSVNIVGKGEIRGTIWKDNNNDGWPNNDGEPGLPYVPVKLYGCMRADGVTMETGTSSSKDCETITGGNTWATIKTTTTDASGNYEFIGLDSGYYIVEVNDTDGSPSAGTGGNSSPFGGTETAEPDDDQSTTSGNADAPTQAVSTFNNTWGVRTAVLASSQANMNLLSAAIEETVNGVNFGYYMPNATIYGKVWHDVDGDTVTDANDTGLSGFTVKLYLASGGGAVATTTTDANGNYWFTGLAANSYIVEVTPPVLPRKSWVETVETTGGTGSLDNRIPVTVAAGAFSGSHDFGYTKDDTASVGDTLFYDFNGNGAQDAGEEGIPFITVSLYRDVDRDGTIDPGVDELVGTQVTDASGRYLFSDLAYGSYVVVVDTSDADFPTNVTATADPDTNAASIGDQIFLDADGDGVLDAGEDGIPGVTLLLYEDTDGSGTLNAGDKAVAATATDVYGKYLFTGLTAGTYFVDVVEATLPSSALAITTGGAIASASPITLAGSTSAYYYLTADAGYSPSSGYAIGDRVWSDADGDGVQDLGEAGIGGVALTITGTGCAPCNATTNKSGFWLVTGLTNGATYAVAVNTATLTGGFASTTGGNSQSKTISSADNMSADFGYRYNTDGNLLTRDTGDPTGTINGRVFLDKDGDAAYDSGEEMAGTTVNLFDSAGNLVATTQTDASGQYSFGGVFTGTYSVQAVDEMDTRYSTIFLSAGATFSNLNVIYSATRSAVADSISSVSVSGVYADLRQDFGYQRYQGSIGDTIYLDVNENSDQDFGEPGLSGVTVNLYLWKDAVADGGNGDGIVDGAELTLQKTAVTSADNPLTAADESGKYLFTNLTVPPAGQYYLVRVDTSTLPGSGYTLVADPDTDGYPCTALPNPDDPADDLPPPGVCDNQQVVSGFTDGVNYLGADFGYTITGSGYAAIGDQLWVDADTDGVFDSGELGVPFITVYFDTDNDNALDWTDTNGNGEWDAGEGERWVETDLMGYYIIAYLADGTYNHLKVLTSDPDWPAGLITTPVYEVRPGNNDSLNNDVNVTISGGTVTMIADGDPDTPDGCTDCNLSLDFGYVFSGTNTLSGTICTDDPSGNGYCGVTASTYSGVDSPNETALAGVIVSFYRWDDTDSDNTAWAADGTLDAGDVFTLLGSTSTDGIGDYSFAGLPDKIVVVFAVAASQNLALNTTNANTSVEDAGVVSHELFDGTAEYDGNTVTVFARQALDLSGDADNVIQDLDFAFDGTLGGAIAYDFGDLPDSGTPDFNDTLLGSGGAQHRIVAGSIYMGSGVSTETDGKDSATASADTYDDGVTLTSLTWKTGPDGASVVVNASAAGWVAGWVDFNQDGDFNDLAEAVFSRPVSAGNNTISFFVPDTMAAGANTFFARFRIYPEEPLLVSSTGMALNSLFAPTTGEVEDYRWNLNVTVAVLSSLEAYWQGNEVAVRWSTSTEADTIGYFLYRTDESDAEPVLVSGGLLPGVMAHPRGGSYLFLDKTAVPEATYRYRLMEATTQGERNFLGNADVLPGQGPQDLEAESKAPDALNLIIENDIFAYYTLPNPRPEPAPGGTTGTGGTQTTGGTATAASTSGEKASSGSGGGCFLSALGLW
ncbi:MAG: SdrD B-like domain-containing protein [Thermodesulfobacteriota bacterium]